MPYIDIQVNGYAGVSFQRDDLTLEQMQFAGRRLREDDVEAILVTTVTAGVDQLVSRLSRLRRLIDQDATLRKLMPAFHIEGPCLSTAEGYRGAHATEHLIPATVPTMEQLVEAAGGPDRVAMGTLAPEVDRDLASTRWLRDQGIVVALGHTDAEMSLLREAEAAGAGIFTHFGNGSAATMNRHDNIIHRAMALDKIVYSLIPDGHHVPLFVLRSWTRLLGVRRCLFTTDCISAAGAGPDAVFQDWQEVDRSTDTPVVRFKGTPYLAGSALTPPMGYRNAVAHLGLSDADAMYMWYDHPRAMFARWLKP
ncbi:MAG: hypothetical protein IT440_04105 [Phycisphaeraceae bacterium]|nr:hypothetical protein [Phycisphaeraceae bacterium]